MQIIIQSDRKQHWPAGKRGADADAWHFKSHRDDRGEEDRHEEVGHVHENREKSEMKQRGMAALKGSSVCV